MRECQVCQGQIDVIWSDTCKECRDMGCDYVAWECTICYGYMSQKDYEFSEVCSDCYLDLTN